MRLTIRAIEVPENYNATTASSGHAKGTQLMHESDLEHSVNSASSFLLPIAIFSRSRANCAILPDRPRPLFLVGFLTAPFSSAQGAIGPPSHDARNDGSPSGIALRIKPAILVDFAAL